MNALRESIILIFGNIIVGALLASIEPSFSKTILVVGLILVDIAAIYAIVRKILKGK